MKSGDVIANRFRLQHELGAGGLGVVWAATQISINRTVAIKFLKSPTGDTIRRFEAEAKALARLHHPGCVTLHEFGRTGQNVPYIVMEYVTGPTLGESRGTRRTVPQVVEILEQLLAVLSYAHAQGIAHRDLKPENVVVTQEARLVVLDFGLAKITGLDSADLTNTGEVFGTPIYMSPEQLRGSRDAGPPSDVYALGVMAFELLTGRAPYPGSSMLELAMGHLGQIPPEVARDDCPVQIKRLIGDMLAKEPARRPTAAQALRRINPQTTNHVATESERPPITLAIGLVCAVIVLLLIVVVLVVSQDETSPTVAVKQVVVTEPSTAAVDSGLQPTTVLPPASCSRPSPGFGKLTPGLGTPWVYYAPEKNAGTARAVVVVYQTDRVSPEKMFRGSGLIEKADEHGFLLLGWEGTVKHAPQIVASTFDALDELDKEACVDRDRLYAIGHASGGAAALKLGCHTEIAAIATASYNPQPNRAFECEHPQPIPAIHVAPRNSGHAPLSGQSLCRPTGAMPTKDFESHWRERNACSNKGATHIRSKHGKCERWDCDEPFVACRVDGGHDWPGVDSGDQLTHCVGTPTKFAVTDVVVDFLLQHQRRPIGCGSEIPDGTFTLDVEVEGQSREIRVWVPKGYDPDHAYPVLYALGYARHDSDDYPLRAQFAGAATSAGYVVIAPTSHLSQQRIVNAWSTEADDALLRDAVNIASEQLCLDRSRVFGISHSNGATRLQELSCEIPFAGLVLTGMAEHDPPQECVPLGPPPTLRIVGREDPFVPILGGHGCDGKNRYLSADETDAVWKEERNFGCRGRKTPWKTRPDVCSTWSCETPYVSCQVDGGPFFRASELETNPIHTPPNCQRPGGRYFDLKFSDTVLPFFEQVAR